MTEKKVGLLATIRKLFDEHNEVLTIKKLYELLGDRMVEYDDVRTFKHRVRASLNALKKKGELIGGKRNDKWINGKGKWKKA